MQERKKSRSLKSAYEWVTVLITLACLIVLWRVLPPMAYEKSSIILVFCILAGLAGLFTVSLISVVTNIIRRETKACKKEKKVGA